MLRVFIFLFTRKLLTNAENSLLFHTFCLLNVIMEQILKLGGIKLTIMDQNLLSGLSFVNLMPQLVLSTIWTFNCTTIEKKIDLVFCYQNCSALLWEKNVIVIETIFEIRSWRPRICKNFEITRTIYSNSERSEQFLVT